MSEYKVDQTIQAYEHSFKKNSRLIKKIKNISSKMSNEVKLILDNSPNKYISGEMTIYNLLAENGIDDKTAARIALLFPEPLKFDPAIISINHGENLFLKHLKEGKQPLEALVEVSNDLFNDFTNSRYKDKAKEFERYIFQSF